MVRKADGLVKMTQNELQTIKESIEKIEKFPVGFPKKIECTDVRWKAFFDWEADLCFRRRNELSTGETNMTRPLGV